MKLNLVTHNHEQLKIHAWHFICIRLQQVCLEINLFGKIF